MNRITSITLKTPAKINLGLEIIEKMGDGYHRIETLFQSIDLFDELTFSSAEGTGITISTNLPDLAIGEENIVWKAALRLFSYLKCQKGVKIHVKKRIPLGAGLGGGSSDAAATLKGLVNLYALTITQQEIKSLAASLGADVPFFLNGPVAYGFGRGDSLEPISPLPPFWVVIVKPCFSISTAWAYTIFDAELTKSKNKIKILKLAVESADTERIGKALFNDLEQVCIARYPVLGEIKERFLAYGACGALMSGSGSAVFGLFSDKTKARIAWEAIKRAQQKGEEALICRTILK